MPARVAADPLPGIQRVDKLYLELLFRCNFRCGRCYHGSDLDRSEMVQLPQAVRALEYFSARFSCQQVCFLGGEPLLYPRLPELLAAAKGLGFSTQICTNAYKRRQVLTACLSYLDLLRVSLDGGTAETHDAIRRSGSFAAVFDTLDWANENRLPFGATCTLTAENIATVPGLARRLHELGARELILHRLRGVGNALETALKPVSWEHTRRLHTDLAELDLNGMYVNSHISLPRGGRRAVVSADFHRLPFKDTTFDAAIAAFCLYHASDPTTVIREISRYLHGRGVFIAVTKAADSYGELDELLAGLGLTAETSTRSSLYAAAHSANILPLAAPVLQIQQVLHAEHLFRFESLEHLAGYLMTTPKYAFSNAAGSDHRSLAEELRRRGCAIPVVASSTVSYLVGVPDA
ncbi:radical SAM protein [Thermobifida halotolerans]|uniref:Radical SAM protein n=1 Tax=Thermobifida halotolerans TaxID=483545 RepID=A0AA97M5P5_9ACTN|nr:radical SAM protein [Thermobifida halotolerans]UOE21280.1 radical SAM protein [Thermobifida halotolerans]